MKTIPIHTQNAEKIRDWEELRYYYPLFEPYFSSIESHTNPTKLMGNRAYFFANREASLPEYLRCGTCSEPAIAFDIEVPKKWNKTALYEFGKPLEVSLPATNFLGCKHIVSIVGGTLGFYCPRKNILYASDWTHLTDWKDVIKEIIEKLQAHGLKKLSAKVKREKVEVSIGADPEIEVIKHGGVEEPSHQDRNFDTGNIGRDSSQRQAEIRPEPSTNPADVVANIRDLLQELSAHYEELSVEGNHFSLGGHVHFGVKYETNLVNLLNHFIGEPLRKQSGKARQLDGYGHMSDTRTNEHGFEYRTPPSAWLVNPEVTKVFIKLARNLVNAYFNEEKSIVVADTLIRKDVKRYGKLTDKETDIYFKLINGDYKKEYKAICKEWKFQNIPRPLLLSYSATFTGGVMDIIGDILSDVRSKPQASIYFYGLRKDRGEVFSGVTVEGFKAVKTKGALGEKNAWSIGIPFYAKQNFSWWNSVNRKNFKDAIIKGLDGEVVLCAE